MSTKSERRPIQLHDQTPVAAAVLVKYLRVDGGQKVLKYLASVDNQAEITQQIPHSVELIAPPSSCAQQCVYCSADARTERVLLELKARGRESTSPEHKLETVLAVVDELAEMGTKGAIWSGGGDWCVYPWITEAIAHAHQKGFENNFWISHFAARRFTTEEAERAVQSCTSIRASVDGPDVETYNVIRNPLNKKAFHIMKENVRAFVAARERTGSSVRLGIQMLLLENNISKIEEMVSLASELGVDYIQVRPIEPTGQHYDEQGKPVGIHNYSEFYSNLSMFGGLEAYCKELAAKYGVQVLYRADKVADIEQTGLDTLPTRPAEFCDGALQQAVIQFDVSFKAPELLHCYYRDDLKLRFTPGELAAVLFSPERQECADCANATPDKCSAGCKYVTSGFNPAMVALRGMSVQQRLITIQELLGDTAGIEMVDPYII